MMDSKERNLERMKESARRMYERHEEFLRDRADRIKAVVEAAETDSTVTVDEFVERLRETD